MVVGAEVVETEGNRNKVLRLLVVLGVKGPEERAVQDPGKATAATLLQAI